MRLALKIVLAVVALLAVLLLIEGKWASMRERELILRDAKQDAMQLGRSLRLALQQVWRQGGDRAVEKVLKSESKGAPLYTFRWLPRSGADPVRVSHQVVDTADGASDLLTLFPVGVDGRNVGSLEIRENLVRLQARIEETQDLTVLKLGLLMLLGSSMAVLLGFLFVGRPLRRLMGKSRRIGEGKLDDPLQLQGHDELSDLARSMNEMCDHLVEARKRVQQENDEKLQAIEQLRHQDRLKTVGMLASGMAHEMGTPLNVISGRAGLIGGGLLPAEQVKASADIIKQQAERITGLIRRLLDFARKRPANLEEVDLAALVGRTGEMLDSLARKSKVHVSLDLEERSLHVQGSAERLQQVLTNLMVNAIQAMPDGGELRVGLAESEMRDGRFPERPDGAYVVVAVEDEGCGIPEEMLDQLFDPFFTTKDVGVGTGLGLSIAYGIVSEHRGWIQVESQEGEGSVFRVFLPRGEWA